MTASDQKSKTDDRGVYTELTVGGKVFKLRPLRAVTYDRMIRFIRDERPDVIVRCSKLINEMNENDKRIPLMLESAFQTAMLPVSETEIKSFRSSVRGMAWIFQQLVMNDHPEIDSIEKALALLEQAGSNEFAGIAAGLDV